MKDTTNNTFKKTVELKDADVVCGRGGLANKHPGNRILRRICSENKSLYQSTMNPAHKQCLIASILMAIQQHGGRFVSRTKSGLWEEISDKKAKEKTAQLLRESDAPITSMTSKPMTIARTKPVVTMDSSRNDYMTQTEAQLHQPMLIPPEPTLPAQINFNANYTATHHRQVTPDTVSSDDFSFPMQTFVPGTLPLPLPPAPVAPMAPTRAFDDGDLFDLIPLEAAGSYGIESNPEFQDLCHVLSAAC
ncbi:unnamed protein product [Cylindrotheca closterium]|uniref:DUF6824 domain-containing protein n=1 Tax=Cylindrotheca closterium TaxID=2856 RepID=A0AAD2CR08_9STRA|nr:unnamed protein product [Cylindrotheca closterium]